MELAAICSLLGGYLLLPSATTIDIQFLPPIDKFSVPALSTLLLCLMKGTQRPAPRQSFLIYLFALAYVVSPILTSLDNSYELHIGDRSIPGFYPANSFKIAAQNLLTLAPFYVGMRYLSSDDGRALLLKSIPIAGLFYSLPMLFEIRMSPQLHNWVYGFFPHSFAQTVRSGGFRPVVFLSHGLEVALFTSIAFIGAVIAARARWRLLHMPAVAAAAYLGGLLLLCKSLGSILYGALCAPLVLFTKPRTWVRISCVIVTILCAYPMLRTLDLVPVSHISAAASAVSADRSGSFETRIDNENKLLAKANQKPWFGWGTWGRNRVFDEESGKDVSITDGGWILRFGTFGWFGYLALFGIFATAVYSALSDVKGPVTPATIAVGGLTLMLAVNLMDVVPNAFLLPFSYILAGSVSARLRVSTRERKAGSRAGSESSPRPAVVAGARTQEASPVG